MIKILSEKYRRNLEKVLNILYPRHCPACHEILADQGMLICPECLEKLEVIRQPRCFCCGRPVPETEEYCRDCRSVRHWFVQGRGIVLYNDIWKKSIEKYKYGGCREYAFFYAKLMDQASRYDMARWNPDVITGVPLYWKKERMRGFNQSWEIARLIAEMTGVAAEKNLVKKKKNTSSQKKLGRQMRMRNLADAFRVERPVRGMRILVIDDVYTTGSTMDAMAQVLMEAGASSVYFLTFSIGILS